MTITELLESWKERAEKAEAELQKAAALINTSRNEAAVSSVTCGQMRKELERVQAAAAEMRDAAEMLWTVVANVSGGDWTKQSAEWQTAAARWRDAYHKALANDAGTGYVRKEDVVRDVKPLLDALEKIMFASPCSELDVPYTARVAELALAHEKSKGLTE